MRLSLQSITNQTRRSLSGSINVLVKDKETGNQSVITYKAFRDTQYRFDLIGQVDDLGNLMDTDPNLSPQHQRKVVAKSPAAVDVGGKDIIRRAMDDIKNASPQLIQDVLMDEAKGIAEELAVKNFNTPHPNDGHDFNEVDKILDKINPTAATVIIEGNPVLGVLSEESFPDCLPESPTNPATSADQPIKERKKPGPKPKIKE